MIKKELRKLRTLNATPEMIEKAKNNEPKDKSNKRKYGVFMRCQNLGTDGRILKVAIFLPKLMQEGDKTPKYEIFLNYKGGEYITRELKDGQEVSWKTARIENLAYGTDNGWGYLYYSDNYAWINPEGNAQIKKLLGTTEGGFQGIRTWQENVAEERLKAQRKRQTDPWDADMKRIPKRPSGFENWWKKEAITENFIFYEYQRAGAKTGYCSYCEKEVPVENPKHNKKGKCSCCGKEITFKSSGKVKTLGTDYEKCQLIQNIENGFAIRTFEVCKWYTKEGGYKKPHFLAREMRRTLYRDGAIDQYEWELYKNVEHRWCKQDIPRYYRYPGEGKIYKGNIATLKKGEFKRSSLPILIESGYKVNAEKYLAVEEGNPAIEKLIKIGLIDLALEMMNSGYDKELYDQEQSVLTKMLKIDKERLGRLKGMNGKIVHLKWLQMEKKENTIYQNGVITYFADNNVKPEDLKFISDVMSYEKIKNYLIRQQELIEDSVKQMLTTWRDYLNMAEKAKMPVKTEAIYKPKDLKEKHNELILMLQEGNIKKQAKDILKKFKHVNEVCQTLGKYEYKGEKYIITTPKSVEDIIKEGISLQHCIHTCDYYFDRINRKESFIMFLRWANSPNTPYYTLEVEPGGNVRQKRTTGDNQNKDFDAAVTFIKKWQKWLKKQLSEEDKELGQKADELRKKNYQELREKGNRVWHGKLAGKLLADVLEEDFLAIDECEEEKELLEAM